MPSINLYYPKLNCERAAFTIENALLKLPEVAQVLTKTAEHGSSCSEIKGIDLSPRQPFNDSRLKEV